MTWYVAHCIMLIRFNDGHQDEYPLYENMLLVQAESALAAQSAAEEMGKQHEILSDPTFERNGRPVSLVFAGIRKVVECLVDRTELKSGVELTYNELLVEDAESYHKLIAGGPASLIIVD